MAANLHGYKDHETLVGAWRMVVDRMEQSGRAAHLLLAGMPGDRSAAVRQQIDATGLAPFVHVIGSVADVAGLLGAVDLAVFSSKAEGIPNAVLEAMLAGIAVVATDYVGIREAVGPAGAGLLARQSDPGDMAEKILTAAADASLRLELGRLGRARVAAEFGADRMCRRMVSRILELWPATDRS
jgi:glycosyltransferase involved in cell wall biosynthesis